MYDMLVYNVRLIDVSHDPDRQPRKFKECVNRTSECRYVSLLALDCLRIYTFR